MEKIDILSRPKHGRVLVENAPKPDFGGVVTKRHILYVPEAGYVGKDAFSLQLRIRSVYGTEPDPTPFRDTISYDVDVVDRVPAGQSQADSASTPTGVDITSEFVESGNSVDQKSDYENTIVHVIRLGTDNKIVLNLFRNGKKILHREGSIGSAFEPNESGCHYVFNIVSGNIRMLLDCPGYTRTETIVSSGGRSCSARLAYALKPGRSTYDFDDRGGVKSYTRLTISHVSCQIAARTS